MNNKKYCKLYANKFADVDELNKLLDRYKVLKLTQEEREGFHF